MTVAILTDKKGFQKSLTVPSALPYWRIPVFEIAYYPWDASKLDGEPPKSQQLLFQLTHKETVYGQEIAFYEEY